MKPKSPALFNRKLRARHLTRAAADFPRYDFLHKSIAEDIGVRLSTINRQFENALIIGSYHGLLGKIPLIAEQVNHFYFADLTAAMLPPQGGIVLDQDNLPLGRQKFDLVISFFDLHVTNHLPQALAQIKQALKADGLCLAVLPGEMSLAPLRQAILQAESDILGGAQPHIHPFARLEDMMKLIQGVGFALPVIDRDIITLNYHDPARIFEDLKGMGERNCLLARRDVSLRRAVYERALSLLSANGGCKIPFEIHFLMGWAPHHSQQQPLKPGSGKTALATVLAGSKTY